MMVGPLPSIHTGVPEAVIRVGSSGMFISIALIIPPSHLRYHVLEQGTAWHGQVINIDMTNATTSIVTRLEFAWVSLVGELESSLFGHLLEYPQAVHGRRPA